MSRIKLELPENFNFQTELQVRISDINYGGHLGNDSVLTLVHEARVQFLWNYGFTEANVAGPGLILSDAVIIYKSQAFLGDVLTAAVTVGDFSKTGCDFFFLLSQKDSGKEVARAKTGAVFFDYAKQKVVEVPPEFIKLFNPCRSD